MERTKSMSLFFFFFLFEKSSNTAACICLSDFFQSSLSHLEQTGIAESIISCYTVHAGHVPGLSGKPLKEARASKAWSVPMPNKNTPVKSILAFYADNQQLEKQNKRIKEGQIPQRISEG